MPRFFALILGRYEDNFLSLYLDIIYNKKEVPFVTLCANRGKEEIILYKVCSILYTFKKQV